MSIPLRWYLYAACALALAGILYHDHYVTKRLNATRHELSTATATIKAERENTRKANEAAERYAISIENLNAARADTPVRTVRLCRASVPAPGPASGADEGDAGGVPHPPGRDTRDRWSDDGPDVGPELYALADEADTCHATLEALQSWVRDR